MRITKPAFELKGPPLELKGPSGKDKPGLDFVETLKDAIESTNTMVKASEQAALALSSGRAPNIHETMIALQKADISVRLVVGATNKLLEAYKELSNLR